MSLEELYQELILDHFKHPRCQGCLTNPTVSSALYNPLCGDKVNLDMRINNDMVSEIGFSGHGCSISQASASMMAETLQGKNIEEAQRLCSAFRELMRSERDGQSVPELGDALALEGVKKFQARIKCAVLAWEAAERCLSDVKSKQ